MPDDETVRPKIGAGHAMAMFRLGGHELTQALQAFPDSTIRPIEEPGAFGNATPQIVTNQMGYDQTREHFAGRAATRVPEPEQIR